MATINVTINLVYTTSFGASVGTQSCAVGDTILMAVNSNFADSSYADPRVSEANGTPVMGENKSSPHTFSYTVPAGDAGNAVNFYFFGSKQSSSYWTADNRLWNFGSPYNFFRREGTFTLNVSAAPANCALTAPSGTISATVATNDYTSAPLATVSGLSASSGCSIKIRATEQSQYNAGNFAAYGSSGVLTATVNRGSTYVFQAAQVGTGTPVLNTSSPIYIPYTTVSNSGLSVGNIVTNNGTFSFTVNGVNTSNGLNNTNGNTNKYFLRLANGVYPLNSSGQLVSAPPGTHTITSNVASNVPSGSTVTYQVWGKRSFSAGGGVGRGQDLQTNASFTVTHTPANTFNEVITETSGKVFDRHIYGAAANTRHTLNITSASSGKYYNVSKSSSSISSPLLVSPGWTLIEAADGTTKTFTVQDAPTVPTGANGTTVTYYLWRSNASNGSTPLYTGRAYTRTLVVDDRFTFGTPAVVMPDNGSTSFSQTINNTIAGHIYKINKGGSTLLSVTATGTTTTVTVPESTIPNPADASTHTLYTQAPLNFPFAYSTGKTYTVTRAGTAPSAVYGMRVFAANGVDKLYDTDSRTARIMAFDVTPSIAAGGFRDIIVTGLPSSTTDTQIAIIPGGASTVQDMLSAHDYVVAVSGSGGQFRLTNNASSAQTYTYYVIRTAGV